MTRRLRGIMAACLVALAMPLAAAERFAPAWGGMLSPSLREPRGTSAAVDARGFIPRWHVLEPIAVTGPLTESAVEAALQATARDVSAGTVPRDGDLVRHGDATLRWHALDTRAYNFNLFHFARALERPTSNVLFWITTVVDAPAEMRDVRLAIGSNAASHWWVNGESVVAIYGDRQTVIDDGVSRRLTLHQGRNVIRAAIVNGGGATDFCARFLDARLQPIVSLRVAPAATP